MKLPTYHESLATLVRLHWYSNSGNGQHIVMKTLRLHFSATEFLHTKVVSEVKKHTLETQHA